MFTETSYASLETSQVVLYYEKVLTRFTVCTFQKWISKWMMDLSNTGVNLLHRTKIFKKGFLNNVFSKTFGNFSRNLCRLPSKFTGNALLQGQIFWNFLKYVRMYKYVKRSKYVQKMF